MRISLQGIIKNDFLFPISYCSNCTSEAMTCFWSGVIRWRRLSRRDRRNQFRTGWGKPSTSHSSCTRPPSPEYTLPSAEYTWTKAGIWTVSDRYKDSSEYFCVVYSAHLCGLCWSRICRKRNTAVECSQLFRSCLDCVLQSNRRR